MSARITEHLKSRIFVYKFGGVEIKVLQNVIDQPSHARFPMFAALDELTSPTTDPSEQDFAVLGVLFLVIDLTAGFLCF